MLSSTIGWLLIFWWRLLLPSHTEASDFRDPRDGESYMIQEIGSLLWFMDNLRYRTEKSECYNLDTSECRVYGRFYGKEEIHGVCPDGWRLPSPKDVAAMFEEMKKNQWDIHVTSFEEEPGAMLMDSRESLHHHERYLNLIPTGWVQGNKFKVGKAAHFWVFDPDQPEKNFHSHVLNNMWNLHQHDHHIEDRDRKQRKFCVRCVRDTE